MSKTDKQEKKSKKEAEPFVVLTEEQVAALTPEEKRSYMAKLRVQERKERKEKIEKAFTGILEISNTKEQLEAFINNAKSVYEQFLECEAYKNRTNTSWGDTQQPEDVPTESDLPEGEVILNSDKFKFTGLYVRVSENTAELYSDLLCEYLDLLLAILSKFGINLTHEDVYIDTYNPNDQYTYDQVLRLKGLPNVERYFDQIRNFDRMITIPGCKIILNDPFTLDYSKDKDLLKAMKNRSIEYVIYSYNKYGIPIVTKKSLKQSTIEKLEQIKKSK